MRGTGLTHGISPFGFLLGRNLPTRRCGARRAVRRPAVQGAARSRTDMSAFIAIDRAQNPAKLLRLCSCCKVLGPERRECAAKSTCRIICSASGGYGITEYLSAVSYGAVGSLQCAPLFNSTCDGQVPQVPIYPLSVAGRSTGRCPARTAERCGHCGPHSKCERTLRTTPAQRPPNCSLNGQPGLPFATCGFRWGQYRWQGACAPPLDGHGHLSGSHRDRRRATAAFPCRRTGTSTATTCRQPGKLPDRVRAIE